MIQIEGISKAFGGLQAVDSVTFTVAAGGITGLIGPNGAGKTTLFSILAGFLPADQGRVLLDGEDITGLPPHSLFHRGLVRTFQIPHEFSRMTVRENLMIVPPGQAGESLAYSWLRWGKVKAQDRVIRQKVDDVLDFLKLTHVADELAGNLSGGQKKLLELGRTMMIDAKVVLLDEPGAGVNRTLLNSIRDAIRRLNTERGYTFCLIEHDMDLIADLCDPVVVMAQGQVIAEGPMDVIRADPQVQDAYLGGGVSGRGVSAMTEDDIGRARPDSTVDTDADESGDEEWRP
ncbi:ABC transporter ATP-binding protein [Roseospira marina]|uniref:ABC transporter ATP-binding protein n=1 Tax=Roseospira marina TaxID=140057 RepID=A0A5M6IIK0_9PROT|nr:ABC transporter ATP-binding protein [Roseospira marina]KAA5607515.1 ABC transporter ATP-binding protein [Roseospira marina]MBB4312301.1 branched-chain amino acid transport system ATP-binding protein [Roseospira marina]MBB5085683.1 branched-chain amino acid transport system ATP-binding protein [Roseospira marina]